MRLSATLALVVGVGAPGSAQVPVGKEPHHRVVFEDARLRVLDVNIPPVRQFGWHATPAVGAQGVRTAAESRSFRASSIALETARPSVTRAVPLPSVVVLVTGEAILTRKGHDPQPLTAAARWRVIGAGEEYTVSSRGEARFVEIEVQ